MKRVFIIPEPHLWDKSFKNRIDYPEEIFDYLSTITETISSLNGDKIIIFPGDVFHRPFTVVERMTQILNLFCDLNELTDGNVYSVVGNHELSYPKCNPFWMLCEDNTDRFIQFRNLPAYGSFAQGIKVVDSLAVGNLLFIFGHYGRTDFDLNLLSNQDCVLISHNSIIEKSINEIISERYKRNTNLSYANDVYHLLSSQAIPITSQLKYVFVGHLHTAYSDFLVDEKVESVQLKFYLRYMGSLGRTSVEQVRDDDLIRTIPQFIIENDSYTYVPFEVSLKPYDLVMKQQVVDDNKNKYAAKKALAYLKGTETFGVSPLESVRRGLSEYPSYASLFEEFVNNSLDADIVGLIGEANNL